MKFKFCGDLDCPDWVLAEIATLSKMTSIKIKLLSAQVMLEILRGQIDYDKVQKLTADAKLDSGGIKASIAALSFIFTSAGKNSTEEMNLSNELQQLGLPKELSTSVCKVYADNYSNLQQELRRRCLRMSQLEDLQWRLDYTIGSSHLPDINNPMIHLKMKVRENDKTEPTSYVFSLTEEKFRVLLYELKDAYNLMETL